MKKTKYYATVLAVVILILFTSVSSKADLVLADDPFWGTGALTVDSRTGLSFLDLTFSLDLSYLQAEAAMQSGGLFEGFRHATSAEVASLYASAGFCEGFIEEWSPRFQNVASLISLTGGWAGITGSLSPNELAFVAYMSYGARNGTPGYWTSAFFTPTQYGLDTHFNSVGNWMVSVPEPSTSALLLTAVAVAGLSRRQKR